MPFTAKQLRRSLKEVGINASQEPLSDGAAAAGYEALGAFFETRRYTNPDDGQRHVKVIFLVPPKATMLKVAVYRAYIVNTARNRARAFMAALGVCARTFLVQAEWNAPSESLGFAIEMPVMDGTLTTAQIHRMVTDLLSVLDDYEPVMRRAAEEGVVDFSTVQRPGPHYEEDEDEDEDDD
jgi:hypothetical protein